MKSSSSFSRGQLQHYIKKERFFKLGRPAPLLVCLTTLFSFYIVYILRTINPTINQVYDQSKSPIQPQDDSRRENCDLFKGHWVPDMRGSLYTNFSCPTIPYLRNCFKYGREDTDFLHWRWKPDGCELPRFDAKAFLKIVQGKTMAFIGDSLARNQIESLLCLLSQVS
ncbi:unnamed protein product [Ilex paraguariensis]|uniref:Trichome birefringence-like N-terminal domain-containing protein n=1 Tax=Ilex paraguariensis TaxID=185542 RepID=A0ABC8T0C7_9AQUA